MKRMVSVKRSNGRPIQWQKRAVRTRIDDRALNHWTERQEEDREEYCSENRGTHRAVVSKVSRLRGREEKSMLDPE